ncbi:MAG: chorismate transformation enzyme, FkbO/Hyg5 family [Burkholderiales bacterium]
MNLAYETFLQQSEEWRSRVLGALWFSAGEYRIPAPDMPPCSHVSMRSLGMNDTVCELWLSAAELQEGKYENIRYRCNDEMLFGIIELSETGFTGAMPLRDATESAYRQIGTLLDKLNYAYVMRFWNYMADINAETSQLERYRQFNIGRQAGLEARNRTLPDNMPAACALGTASGKLCIAFLAGRAAPIAIENPRQMSAYAYPSLYGPRSPSFSRAGLVMLEGQEWLFISGTASIVGHLSVHIGDVAAQTRETLTNIGAVLEQANRHARQGRFHLSGLQFKIYLRHSGDMEIVRAEFDAITGGAEAVYLQADICRKELLIEIEAAAPVGSISSQSKIAHVRESS